MNPKAKIILRELSKYKNPVVLETGCTRHTVLSKALPDGASTYYIAKWIKENGGEFYSIDKKNIGQAGKLLLDYGLNWHCNFIDGNSLEEIPKLKLKFDVVLLDSANDAEQIWLEYQLVQNYLTPGATMIIDDVNISSRVKKKGDKVYPHIKNKGIKHRLENEMLII